MGRIHGQYKLTGSALSARVGQWTQAGIVKSIQRGIITITSGNTTNTATITSVDPSNCSVVWVGDTNAQASPNVSIYGGRLALTNATTVTATVTGTAADAVIGFEVVEYWPGVVKSVQRGTVTIPASATATATATITTVDTLKSSLSLLGWIMSQGAAGAADEVARVTLTNATTVTATRVSVAGTNSVTVGFQVLEWY